MNSNRRQNKIDIVLYFQIHQPWRLRSYSFFDIGENHNYFDTTQNPDIATRVATLSYLPANEMLLNIIRRHPEIKVCFSISGTALDQLHEFCPAVLQSFRKLADLPQVEFLGETAYHSLSSLTEGTEFEEQVLLHSEKLDRYLGVRPSVFRNTELIYSNDIGKRIASLGFKGAIVEGADRFVAKGRNQLYHHPQDNLFKLLPRHFSLSDEIAFRFMSEGRPLTASAFISKMKTNARFGDIILLGMDYETFGEHQREESGIIGFLEDLLVEVSTSADLQLVTPSEVLDRSSSKSLNVPEPFSWADQDRDLSAWLGNDMQRDVFHIVSSLEKKVKALQDPAFTDTWRRLMSSDHFYYISTKRGPDGEVHAYFSPYPSPYEAFMNFMNVIHDFKQEVKKREQELSEAHEDAAVKLEYDRRHHETPVWAMNMEHNYEK